MFNYDSVFHIPLKSLIFAKGKKYVYTHTYILLLAGGYDCFVVDNNLLCKDGDSGTDYHAGCGWLC